MARANGKPETVVQAHAENLETLKRAFAHDHVCLLEAQRVSDGKLVALLCAVGGDGEDTTFTPFAVMVEGNPFELFRPPNPDGGFYPTEQEVIDGQA